jgi:hypothetical protein
VVPADEKLSIIEERRQNKSSFLRKGDYEKNAPTPINCPGFQPQLRFLQLGNQGRLKNNART